MEEKIKQLEFEIAELKEIVKEKERTIKKQKEIIDQIRSLTYEG